MFHLCKRTFNTSTRLLSNMWQNWPLLAVIDAAHPLEDRLVEDHPVEDHLVEDH